MFKLSKCILQSTFISKASRNFHLSACDLQLQKLTRLRIVDNSVIGRAAMMEGDPPKIIHMYTRKKFGTTGDKVLVTIKGEMKKAIVVGCHQDQKAFVPKFDSNNAVLIEENGTPIATRILAPVPNMIRPKLKAMSMTKGSEYIRLLSIATKFV